MPSEDTVDLWGRISSEATNDECLSSEIWSGQTSQGPFQDEDDLYFLGSTTRSESTLTRDVDNPVEKFNQRQKDDRPSRLSLSPPLRMEMTTDSRFEPPSASSSFSFYAKRLYKPFWDKHSVRETLKENISRSVSSANASGNQSMIESKSTESIDCCRGFEVFQASSEVRKPCFKRGSEKDVFPTRIDGSEAQQLYDFSALTSQDSPRLSFQSKLSGTVSVQPVPSQLVEAQSLRSSSEASSDQPNLQKLDCKERKRIVIKSSRPPVLTKRFQLWIRDTHRLLDPFREDDECWLHPSPPAARAGPGGSSRPRGIIRKSFSWQDHLGKHSVALNYGIVSKLINHSLTKQQKDGLISQKWHLSHLCGNWVCLNPSHTTVEPGPVNVSRNKCFAHRAGCLHNPPCLKDKKLPLNPDGKVIDHRPDAQYETAIMTAIVDDDVNDWYSNSDGMFVPEQGA